MSMTQCPHHVTLGFCLDCLREERDLLRRALHAIHRDSQIREVVDAAVLLRSIEETALRALDAGNDSHT